MKKKAIFGLLVTSLILTGMIFSSSTVLSEDFSNSGVNVTVWGDKTVFVNQTKNYEVEIGGTFGKDADNWTLHSRVKGDASVSPQKKESTSSNTFTLNLTVEEKGSVKLILEAYCAKDDEIRQKEKSLEISAVKPASVKVTVDNPKNMTLENVRLGLFIDGDKIKTITLEKLEPFEKKTVVINYSKENLNEDKHELEVWVDYGFHDSPGFYKNEKLLEQKFYVTEDDDDSIYGWVIGLSAVGAIVVFLLYRRRRKKRRRPW